MQDKEITLQCGIYDECDLVDKLCSVAQRNSYHKKNKFAGGKYQQMFLKTLARYCEYEYHMREKKYSIMNVYAFPKAKCESKVHTRIYQYLTPLLINELLTNEKYIEQGSVFTNLDLAKEINLVNQNYNKLRFKQKKVAQALDVSEYALNIFLNTLNGRINNYIRHCLNYLSEMRCITYQETHMVETMLKIEVENLRITTGKTELREATKKEMELYSNLDKIASIEAGITSGNEKWYGAKSLKYKNLMYNLLKDNGILYIQRAFKITHIDKKQCQKTLQTFTENSLSQCKEKVGLELKKNMDTNAENKLKRNSELGKEYAEQFKKLSDITLLHDEKNVLESLLAEEDDCRKTVRKKCKFKIEYITDNGGNKFGIK